jgi:hypothetical protein
VAKLRPPRSEHILRTTAHPTWCPPRSSGRISVGWGRAGTRDTGVGFITYLCSGFRRQARRGGRGASPPACRRGSSLIGRLCRPTHSCATLHSGHFACLFNPFTEVPPPARALLRNPRQTSSVHESIPEISFDQYSSRLTATGRRRHRFCPCAKTARGRAREHHTRRGGLHHHDRRVA